MGVLEAVGTLAGVILSITIGSLTMSIKRAHNRLDNMSHEMVSKEDLKEKLDDKMEAVRVELREQKEDINEIKHLLRRLTQS